VLLLHSLTTNSLALHDMHPISFVIPAACCPAAML
jgi:hypothetical protein